MSRRFSVKLMKHSFDTPIEHEMKLVKLLFNAVVAWHWDSHSSPPLSTSPTAAQISQRPT
ncbi:MAG TPA: hypothetical protein VF290_23320 [Pyrinomonadaceae bacterium]